MLNTLKNAESERRATRGFVLVVVTAASLMVVGCIGHSVNRLGQTAAPPPLLVLNPVPPVAPTPVIEEVKTIEAPPVIAEEPIAQTPTEPEPQLANPPPQAMTFDGRPLRKSNTLRMLVTAYSPDEQSCGKWAKHKTTASGFSVWTNGMKLVAADTQLLPFGSIVTIPGYHDGKPVPVLDRGGSIKGNRLDVLYPTHEFALRWGAQHLDVTVWEYAD